MSLSFRITLLWASIAALALGVQAWDHLRHLDDIVENEVQDDLRVLASAVAHAAGVIWQRSGPAASAAYIRHTNERRSHVAVRFRQTRARQIDRGPPKKSPSSRTKISKDDSPTVQLVGAQVVASTLVKTPRGAAVGSLTLTRGLGSYRTVLHEAMERRIVSVALALIAILVLSYIAGRRFVAKPVAALAEKARRVGQGELERGLQHYPRNELGFLDRELDNMIDCLKAARTKIHEERIARTEALEKLRHADRLSTVGKIASGIAHELGTPLNVISGRASMIAMDEQASAEIHRHAEIIERQTQRMTMIIQQLLGFSRKQALKNEDVNIARFLDEALQLIEPLAHKHNTQVAVQAPETLTANIDAGKTMQVITNLMVNGIQAMDAGGYLSLRAETRFLENPPDKRSQPGEYLALAVQDTGKGIPEDKLLVIFESFYTTKKVEEGTGLGLSVCQEIVQEQDGFIHVESKIGCGSKFCVFLPLKYA